MKKLSKIRIILFLLPIMVIVFVGLRIWEATTASEDVKPDKRKDLQVILYVKEGCSYCMMAEELLEKNNIAYEVIDLSSDKALQQKFVNQTGQTTVPYIFINNKFIGGYTNLLELQTANEL